MEPQIYPSFELLRLPGSRLVWLRRTQLTYNGIYVVQCVGAWGVITGGRSFDKQATRALRH